WSLLGDARPVVRQRACREFVHRKDSPELKEFILAVVRNGNPSNIPDEDLRNDTDSPAAIARVWTLSQIEIPESRRLIRDVYLAKGSEPVRHVAMQSISLHRDEDAKGLLAQTLQFSKKGSNRRIAAEALGRLGDKIAVPNLLDAAAKADDRELQHSVIYALIELAEEAGTRRGLKSESSKTVAAALIALDQMPGGDIKAGDVIPHLGASDETLQQAARWVVSQHAEWGGDLAEWLQQQLKALPKDSDSNAANDALENMLVVFAAHPAIQQLLADDLTLPEASAAVRALVLRVMKDSKLQGPPKSWVAAIAGAIANSDATQLPLAIAAAGRFPIVSATDAKLSQALLAIADSPKYPLEARVDALAIVAGKRPQISDSQFELLKHSLSADNAVAARSAAADAVSKSHLSRAQLDRLCVIAQQAGPLELNHLFKPFESSTDDALGAKLVESLKKSSAASSVRMDLLHEALAKYGPATQKSIAELEAIVNVDAAAQRKRIEELLPLVATGDVRRGNAVFFSAKASCSSCHRLGYAGGTTGPELSHVGDTRTERDILESILFPSLSFVRSYEPMLITTQDGKTINGVIRDENTQQYVVATGPDQIVRVLRADVDDIQPSKVSIMPAGLDKQLTKQELADLVAFLKSTGTK
ncbi:MAG TPA: HEAT repeat domain-containing protein, partial [Lacipirellulaceae bacterium]|nr:HEAT repeat domain-containing protein [Lacipirellulaceae bacterium]